MTTPDPAPAAPCTWPADTSGVPGWGDAEPAQQGLATAIAAFVLWALSGRQFGLCTRTVRPCPPPRPPFEVVHAPARGSNLYTGMYGPWQLAGMCGHLGGTADCTRGHAYPLPGPVAAITEILIDGAVLDPGNYRTDGNSVIRTDARWPASQDLTLEATEPGTWAITYLQGNAVPVAGQYATGLLAGEILKALRSDAACRLPSRAQSVSRQGVDVQLINPDEFLSGRRGGPGGHTGIRAVDLWLSSVNPHRLAQPPRVWSPDLPSVHS